MNLKDILATAIAVSPKLAKHAPVISVGIVVGEALVKAAKKRKVARAAKKAARS